MDLAAATLLRPEGGLALGVVATVLLAGFRHGFDIDHVAAITDITSSQTDRKRALVLATIYALGHMLVVLALGTVAALGGQTISGSIDTIAGRAIGLSLVLLGVYVLYSLIRFRRDFRMQSRWMLAVAGVRRVLHWIRPAAPVEVEHTHAHEADGHHDHSHSDVHEHVSGPTHGGAPAGTAVATRTHTHTHRHVVSRPTDPFHEYGPKTSFLIGMIHGVGAETPTQVLLFTSAAGVAGSLGGIALVGAFVLGLLLGNSVLALLSSAGFAATQRLLAIYMGIAASTALISIYVGGAYFLGDSHALPGVLGG